MAKDNNDKVTRDLIDSPLRGGRGRGQGRKKSGVPPKKPLPAKIKLTARSKVKEAAETTGQSQAFVMEWLIDRMDINALPKKD